MPTLGSAATSFTLLSQEGSPISLKDYREKWVVLYFYPKDQTPGCTREAHNFEVKPTQIYRAQRGGAWGKRGQRGVPQEILFQGRTELQTPGRYRR